MTTQIQAPAPRTVRTADIFLAAFLKTAAVPLVKVERGKAEGEEKRLYFYFEKLPGSVIDDLKREYFNRVGKVVAATYADEYRALKTLSYEMLGG